MMGAWFHDLFQRCPRHLRAMGYLRELKNLRARADRCWYAWRPHLERSRTLILAAAERCPTRRKAVILGSGWLHDVPVEELAGRFREVVLVDLFHPCAVRRRCRRWPHVRLLPADVTGVLADVFQAPAKPGTPLPCSRPALFLDDPEVDLVASVNLLSQLPHLPTSYLNRTGVFPQREIEAFGRGLVEAHLAYLRRLAGIVALITDVESLTLDRRGQEIERESVLHGVELPWRGESWMWDLAPRLEADRDRSYRRQVVGVVNIHDV